MNKAWSSVLVALLKYVLGPILAAILGMSYSDRNHGKSVKGYEVLASALNGQVLARLSHTDQRLDVLDARLDRIESTLASQLLRPKRTIVPGVGADPFDTDKGLAKEAPAAAFPAPAAHKPAPRQQLVPPKM